jgi:hypothetical protein
LLDLFHRIDLHLEQWAGSVPHGRFVSQTWPQTLHLQAFTVIIAHLVMSSFPFPWHTGQSFLMRCCPNIRKSILSISSSCFLLSSVICGVIHPSLLQYLQGSRLAISCIPHLDIGGAGRRLGFEIPQTLNSHLDRRLSLLLFVLFELGWITLAYSSPL